MGWVLVKTYEYPYMGIFLWGGTRARIDGIALQRVVLEVWRIPRIGMEKMV